MKESASFSGNEVEKISLDFSKLREEGIRYIQQLSGDTWTDFNSHDPGVTILEQLIYALTDVAYRTSLPIEDLLTTAVDLPIDTRKNAFFSASDIQSTHPVTLEDTRKMIIDTFEEIQNVWVTTTKNSGFEEKRNGINLVEILPKIKYLKSLSETQEDFQNKVREILNNNRNIGEYYKKVVLLKPQLISIDFHIYLSSEFDFTTTLSKVFLTLLEYIYSPIQRTSLAEIAGKGNTTHEIFSGPRLKNGYISELHNKERLTVIYAEEIKKLLTRIDGILRCEVKPFNINGELKDFMEVSPKHFFHVLNEDFSNNFIDNRFDNIYKNMTVFVNNKELKDFNRQKINNLFSETWSKKYRSYPLPETQNEFFSGKLKGIFQEPAAYHSVQRHFPVIYGIGPEGLTKHDTEERHARAKQLKAFLMLFEQHFANHLAQLGNLNEFFNIDYENGAGKTYFTQWMDSVPGIDKLTGEILREKGFDPESEKTYFDRKNRIYDHLLARFGEDINDIPWRVSRHVHLIRDDREFNEAILRHKSLYLQNLVHLSYNQPRGEFQTVENAGTEKQKTVVTPAGVEEIIKAKTGIDGLPEMLANELKIPYHLFENIDKKILFRETLKKENYRIVKSDNEEVTVEFQKEKNNWVRIAGLNEKHLVGNSKELIDFFIQLNRESENLVFVDHILLDDMLTDSKFGFKFIDYDEDESDADENPGFDENIKDFTEDDFVLFKTMEEQSWATSSAKREQNLRQFFRFGKEKKAYHFINEECVIQDNSGEIIASCKRGIHNRETTDAGLEKIYKKTRDIIRFFTSSEKSNGRMRFKEMEKIRLLGTKSPKYKIYGQRRLVYQRKLWNNQTVDENFFNLKISVLLPDWPVRFQNEQFTDYVSELIRERLPSHINCEIFWIGENQMKPFVKAYSNWRNEKARSLISGNIDGLRETAFNVYQQLRDLKK